MSVNEGLPTETAEYQPIQKRIESNVFFRIVKYVAVRAITIAITIFIGIFITVVIANRGGFVDATESANVEIAIRDAIYSGQLTDDPSAIEQVRAELYEKYGLNLPFLPRHLRWTAEVLAFRWGNVLNTANLNLRTPTPWGWTEDMRSRIPAMILTHFPNTLLLIGSADLIIFLFGIPLALYLSRRYGGWLDKLIVAVSPISSIPSWVHGIFLVIIFAIQLHLLPFNGMFDSIPPATKWGYILVVLKHMVLPVSAIVLSLLFQAIYAWRTYFLIHASEDYVELGRAKGLSDKLLQRFYILRPGLPYIVTSFALMLLGFWQMTTALEYFFKWPGIGWLYVESLGVNVTEIRTVDSMIVLGIIVVFAYLMGITILLLDAVYALLDPRVRIGEEGRTLRPSRIRLKKSVRDSLRPEVRSARDPGREARFEEASAPVEGKAVPRSEGRLRRQRWMAFMSMLREIIRYPSAATGLVTVLILIVLAIYTVIAIPPSRVAQLWNPRDTGRQYLPENARPTWFNWFRRNSLPSTIILDSRNGSASKSIEQVSGQPDFRKITLEYTFRYEYGDFPQDLAVYFYPTYENKRPFVSLIWITPDGREFQLGNISVITGTNYILSLDLPVRYCAPDICQRMFPLITGSGGHSATVILFYDPAKPHYSPIKGTYTLRIDGMAFEKDSDIDAELVILGRVYGLAGTDNRHRDLMVPLLWGLPVALAFGFVGAVVTTFLSMLVAAAGAWFGGWVDALSQRLTEANMILPVLAVGVLVFYYYGVNLWVIMAGIVLLNIFSSTTKINRAAFLQVREAPYIDAAQAYGAGHGRIILRYLVPRILPVLVPQLVTLIPAYVFLEATLGIFGVGNIYIPTWGRIIYDAIKYGMFTGEYYWLAEPVFLLMLTGLAFAILGFALDRILNPRLREA